MATTTEIGTLRNFIDGQQVDPAAGGTDDVLNPATGETIAQAPSSGPEDVDRAVKAARRAFDAWAATTPGERALALLKIADAVEARADELAELVLQDSTGAEHALGDYWRDGPAVLVFIRHYG